MRLASPLPSPHPPELPVLLPNEPSLAHARAQERLTQAHLAPALGELEALFLALRAELDPVLRERLPLKLGRPYPIGQCLEISLAVQRRVQESEGLDLPAAAQAGLRALRAFLAAGGQMRLVWGVLREQYFQNAFQIGSLYVDASNDTVVPTKPKVEILPFEAAQLAPVADYVHFADLARRYWGHAVYPNHLLPEIAPFAPLLHVGPSGAVALHAHSDYMLSLAARSGFRASAAVLEWPAMPEELFAALKRALGCQVHAVAASPEQGRARALRACRRLREEPRRASAAVAAQALLAVNGQLRGLRLGPGGTLEPVAAPPQPAPLPVAVTPERHGALRWARPRDFRFAAADLTARLTLKEVPRAMLSMPLAFLRAPEGFIAVAVLGVAGGNGCVDAQGRWTGDFRPAAYDSHPFRLLHRPDGRAVLAVIEEEALVEAPQGEPFFDAAGRPSTALEEARAQLQAVAAGQRAVARACALMRGQNLLVPWTPVLQRPGGRLRIDGLYTVDEARLAGLTEAERAALADAGALMLAECQLLSRPHFTRFGALLEE